VKIFFKSRTVRFAAHTAMQGGVLSIEKSAPSTSVPSGVDAELRRLTATDEFAIGTGGGVANEVTMTIEDCAISGNTSEFEYGWFSGGGIYNAGEARIINSTMAGNRADLGDAIAIDPRGQPRPGGTMCDVGEFEAQP